jgi:DNA-binding CsgD family transcriptional regulator
VRGLVLKELAPELLVETARRVHAGEQCFDSALVGQAVQSTALREEAADRIGRLLTPREREILAMVSSGLRNRAIGERLSISEGTVKLHLHHIYEKLAVDGRRIAVLGVHTLPPVGADYAARRDAALAATAVWARAQRAAGRAPVVLGDLNATPFSAPLRRLLADAGLVDSQRGFGLQGSWPVGLPLRISIDHCLHDPTLATVTRALGPDLGSDHLPLRVDLAWSSGQVF